jgi:eukaryotic-like serine/threonine-protein kinase
MTTGPDRWGTIERLYHAALAQPADRRAVYLAEACAGDEAVRREVESLLAQDPSQALLTGGAAGVGAGLVSDARAAVTGRRIGVYQVLAPIGAGGMGEVYRARDTRLGRDVAIKILPRAFTADADRLARFEREARVLAALNHPNVASIYGIEEQALVLEYVDGETLADRIARAGSKGLPVDEALDIARQIVAALDAAHEKGIVHRDLKPANIKITSQGVVKVLDFGLAKLDAGSAHPSSSESPTITIDDTREGLIVGTAAYMSPEQARGQAVDKRTDIWAFGCVLYEILTGRAPFARSTATDTLAAIVEHEPDWHALPSDVPASVRRVLHRTLEKDARRRLRDVGDIHQDLDATSPDSDDDARAGVRSHIWKWVPLGASILILAAALAAWRQTSVSRSSGGALASVMRLTWGNGLTTQPALSADGRLVAYASNRTTPGDLDIWVQQTAGGSPIRLTDDRSDDKEPDVSPDGSLIAFRSDRQMPGVYIVSALGGDARLVAPNGRGPKFSPDGRRIAFWTGNWLAPRGIGLVRHVHIVPLEGGSPTQVTTDVASIGDPVWSPDGRSLMVFGRRAARDTRADWWVVPVEGGAAIESGAFDRIAARGITVRATDDIPYPTAWTADGVMFAARMDGSDAISIWRLPVDARGRATGEPVPLTTGAALDVSPTVSRDGRVAFAATFQGNPIIGIPLDANKGKVTGPVRRLREGGEFTRRASLSPDGGLLAFYWTALGHSDLWLKDLRSGRERQLVVTPAAFQNPVISADGRWVGYTVTKVDMGGSAGPGDGYVISTAGGAPRKICEGCEVYSWLDDGRRIFIVTGAQAYLLDVAAGTRTLILSGTDDVDRPVVSPDGRWLSFSVRAETYITPFHSDRASPRADWINIIRSAGAERACGWSPDGRLLYVLLEIDGFRCLYAIPIDAASGRPGAPFPVYHFHNASLQWGSTGFGNATVGGMFLADLFEYTGNIWIGTFTP